jgi:hypothetical protein
MGQFKWPVKMNVLNIIRVSYRPMMKFSGGPSFMFRSCCNAFLHQKLFTTFFKKRNIKIYTYASKPRTRGLISLVALWASKDLSPSGHAECSPVLISHPANGRRLWWPERCKCIDCPRQLHDSYQIGLVRVQFVLSLVNNMSQCLWTSHFTNCKCQR